MLKVTGVNIAKYAWANLKIVTSGTVSRDRKMIGAVARAGRWFQFGAIDLVAEFPTDLDVETKVTLLATLAVIHNFFFNSAKRLRCC